MTKEKSGTSITQTTLITLENGTKSTFTIELANVELETQKGINRQNPNKFSFGKINYPNKSVEEYFMYPFTSLNTIFKATKFQSGTKKKFSVITDTDTIRKSRALMKRIEYYLSLTKKRKKKYLRKKGYEGAFI